MTTPGPESFPPPLNMEFFERILERDVSDAELDEIERRFGTESIGSYMKFTGPIACEYVYDLERGWVPVESSERFEDQEVLVIDARLEMPRGFLIWFPYIVGRIGTDDDSLRFIEFWLDGSTEWSISTEEGSVGH